MIQVLILDQFVSSADAGTLAVAKDGGTVDAVTAATISSRAVTAAVNSAAEIFDQLSQAGVFAVAEAPAVSPSDAVISNSDAVSGADVSASDTNNEGGAQ